MPLTLNNKPQVSILQARVEGSVLPQLSAAAALECRVGALEQSAGLIQATSEAAVAAGAKADEALAVATEVKAAAEAAGKAIAQVVTTRLYLGICLTSWVVGG